MITLGIDFDNTLIDYDELFKKLALEKNLIPEFFTADKLKIRDYLRIKGLDSEFTKLQSLAYGPRINEAKPAKSMLKSIRELIKENIKVIVISHKTCYPYQGPKYRLRDYALEWMRSQEFFSPSGFNLNEESIFFKSTKNEKVDCIVEQKCDYFIDDLIEILQMIPSNIKRIHYCPKGACSEKKFKKLINWHDLNNILNNY